MVSRGRMFPLSTSWLPIDHYWNRLPVSSWLFYACKRNINFELRSLFSYRYQKWMFRRSFHFRRWGYLTSKYIGYIGNLHHPEHWMLNQSSFFSVIRDFRNCFGFTWIDLEGKTVVSFGKCPLIEYRQTQPGVSSAVFKTRNSLHGIAAVEVRMAWRTAPRSTAVGHTMMPIGSRSLPKRLGGYALRSAQLTSCHSLCIAKRSKFWY